MPEAFLGLGSNLGARAETLAAALQRLDRPPVLEITAVSAVYESKAVGLTDQPDFLNLVARIHTSLPPHELLRTCLEVEASLGRVRLERWGPRTIDIDVLLYGEERVQDSLLTVPHPRMAERAFVLAPLAELAPAVCVGDETVAAAARRVTTPELARRGPLDWRKIPPDSATPPVTRPPW